ncbi:hypothetical protein F379_191 [Campylobacter phage F379]|uniref:Uncharacterized protein n=1 Tax=Campylobacter phage F379 TaxID=2776767 RepID=A0A7L8ZKF9_9CAUD|nr:hypothetical protein F379_191 [Campylobacter phage F379]QXO06107.1 hypothetical protein [Campylobacter phage CJLB-12]
MNVRLRIINNQQVPELPSFTDSKEDNLTTDVKLDVLTHQEVDRNFANIITWLKTVSDKIIEQSTVLKQLDPENMEKLLKAAEQIQTITDDIKSLETKYNQVNNDLTNYKTSNDLALSKKLDSIKTINGTDITGSGNAEINITRTQFTNHLTNIGINEIGSIAILDSKTTLVFNNLYAGSGLSTDTYAYMQGTWKCTGKISDTKGLFIRVS